MAADRGPASSGRGALAVLCLCAFTHSYLLFSVFPYGAYYALHLLDGDGGGDSSSGWVTVDTVGVYAGEFLSCARHHPVSRNWTSTISDLNI